MANSLNATSENIFDETPPKRLKHPVFLERKDDPVCRSAFARFGSFASILARLPHVRLRGNLGSSGGPILPVEGIAGSGSLPASKARGQTFRRNAIAKTLSASALILIARVT